MDRSANNVAARVRGRHRGGHMRQLSIGGGDVSPAKTLLYLCALTAEPVFPVSLQVKISHHRTLRNRSSIRGIAGGASYADLFGSGAQEAHIHR